MGWFANKIGQKNALHICLAIWVVVLFSGFLITEVWQFRIMAALTALVMGSTQSVSRTIMGLMTPEDRTGEFFGFFNLSGKAFSMLGPIMFAEILTRTGSANWAILSLLVFFVVGWAIIAPLDIKQGQQQAGKDGTAR
jgi:UMF1 family MFS transporter